MYTRNCRINYHLLLGPWDWSAGDSSPHHCSDVLRLRKVGHLSKTICREWVHQPPLVTSKIDSVEECSSKYGSHRHWSSLIHSHFAHVLLHVCSIFKRWTTITITYYIPCYYLWQPMMGIYQQVMKESSNTDEKVLKQSSYSDHTVKRQWTSDHRRWTSDD